MLHWALDMSLPMYSSAPVNFKSWICICLRNFARYQAFESKMSKGVATAAVPNSFQSSGLPANGTPGCLQLFLVGGWTLPLWKIWTSIGMIISNMWENKKCSKPPTSLPTWLGHKYVFIFSYVGIHSPAPWFASGWDTRSPVRNHLSSSMVQVRHGRKMAPAQRRKSPQLSKLAFAERELRTKLYLDPGYTCIYIYI